MHRKWVLFFLCAALSLGVASWAQSPGQQGLFYEVKLKSENLGDMGTRKMWIKGNNMRWEADSANLPLKLIKNKQGVFMIHPWNKVAAQYSDKSNRSNPKACLPGPTGSPQVFLKAVKAVKGKQQTVNNQLCDVYSYTEPTTSRKCRIWIGAKSGKPVKLVMDGVKGKMDTVTATYVKFDANAKVSDSLFELPKGYAIRPMPAQRQASSKTSGKKIVNKKSG